MKQILLFFKDFSLGKQTLILLTPIISVLMNMNTLILGLVILITIDLLTGIIRSFKEQNVCFNIFKVSTWNVIKSRLLRGTLRKSYEYGILIIVVAIMEAFVLGVMPITLIGKVFTLTELSVVVCSGIETWSIFENIEPITKSNILKKFASFLPKPLQNLFSKEIIK
tara:strand:- start:3330 stop:3830 length:501 start_codon:yes stop_codon:yes gene_type:complete